MVFRSKVADGEYILLLVAEPVLISLFAQQFEAPKLGRIAKMSTFYC